MKFYSEISLVISLLALGVGLIALKNVRDDLNSWARQKDRRKATIGLYIGTSFFIGGCIFFLYCLFKS